MALALAEHALAPARTALGAVPGQLWRHARHEGDLVGVAVVVVQREEPVARRQEVARSLGHGKLKNSQISVFAVFKALSTVFANLQFSVFAVLVLIYR